LEPVGGSRDKISDNPGYFPCLLRGLSQDLIRIGHMPFSSSLSTSILIERSKKVASCASRGEEVILMEG